jgi:Fusaric acid resistance protein-like
VFAAVVVLNAPPARDMPRAMMRIAGTMLGFVLAIGLVALVGHDSAVAFGIALVALLAGLILTPINYAASVTCITCMVSMLYTISGEESDFLKFRVLDNAVGVAAVAAVGLLLARSSTDDWWRVARLTARSTASSATTGIGSGCCHRRTSRDIGDVLDRLRVQERIASSRKRPPPTDLRTGTLYRGVAYAASLARGAGGSLGLEDDHRRALGTSIRRQGAVVGQSSVSTLVVGEPTQAAGLDWAGARHTRPSRRRSGR